jgi:hypothetical protein
MDKTADKQRGCLGRGVRIAGAVLLLLVLLAIGAAAISNATAPTHSQTVERLGPLEAVRLAEAMQLRRTLGERAWPGWGDAQIPVILYNEAYAFLAGYPDPPAGWIAVPGGDAHGGPWRPLPGGTVADVPVYRQPLPTSGITPQAFTVRVGERWAASMTTKEWTQIGLAHQIRGELPPAVAWLIPYRLFVDFMLGSSDLYIALIEHESFHAYQGVVAPARLLAAERAAGQYAARYPWGDSAFQEAWQAELDLLHDALNAESDGAALEHARQFLRQRTQRRAQLEPDLVLYERQREWVEGLAKYIELEIWRQAALATEYEPVAALAADPDFRAYATFERRWSQEVAQLRRMAGDEGDGRFYYTGMAQAVLLDRLAPGWKAQILTGDVWLEDLLRAAVAAE